MKFGIIGLGNIGRNHLRVLSTFDAVKSISVFDTSAQTKNAISDNPKAQWAESCEELFEKSDSVIIAATTHAHFELTKKALELGKNVLVEKPITHSVDEAHKLIALSDKLKDKGSPVVFGVGHVERYNPAVQHALRSVQSGIIGEPITASFRRIGGYPRGDVLKNNVLIDLAVHDIDLARLFVFNPGLKNSDITDIKVLSATAHHVRQKGVADVADLHLGDSGGHTAFVHVNWLTPFRSRMFWVVGSKGFLEVDLMEQSVVIRKTDLIEHFVKSENLSDFTNLTALSRTYDEIRVGVLRQEPLMLELSDFISAISGKTNFQVTPKDGLVALDLATRALQ